MLRKVHCGQTQSWFRSAFPLLLTTEAFLVCFAPPLLAPMRDVGFFVISIARSMPQWSRGVGKVIALPI